MCYIHHHNGSLNTVPIDTHFILSQPVCTVQTPFVSQNVQSYTLSYTQWRLQTISGAAQ